MIKIWIFLSIKKAVNKMYLLVWSTLTFITKVKASN